MVGVQAHTIGSASALRVVDSHCMRIENKNNVLCARFAVGVVLPFSRGRGGSHRVATPRLIAGKQHLSSR